MFQLNKVNELWPIQCLIRLQAFPKPQATTRCIGAYAQSNHPVLKGPGCGNFSSRPLLVVHVWNFCETELCTWRQFHTLAKP